MKKLHILESLRGAASIYVAIGHWILSSASLSGLLRLPFRFGQEAVIIFFILSGLVIFYSYEKGSDKTLRTYFVKRARRIYFPLICALLVSVIFVSHTFSVKELIGNLLMLQDFETGKPGNIVNSFLGNAPLWSLSYEWMFYLLFPFVYPVIKDKPSRIHVIGLFSVVNMVIYILFPNHIFLVLSYFLIWWGGLEVGEYFLGDRKKSRPDLLVKYLLLIIGILMVKTAIFYTGNHNVQVGIYPYLVLRHFGFALLCLAGIIYLTNITKALVNVIKPFYLIAPISYGIYVLHYPIWVQSHFEMNPVLEIVTKIALVAGLAYIIEMKLQPLVNKLFK
ncbi:Peptidoglycan/LPS O-acetylase OafA/YrhL, contains acyltransferase and SGNH-hydrolase domains [Filimonas lacunae]|uniref:Peptidoglycan/LPS O-acetylase OafA/YrhL, contains acyltransferase and SGNH-hydrolase domains n=1 Tax=Filimonas lacunae TaxID=477680 RepID=A0A173M9Z7_9BACT|nr:acyltransferase [Filimonas lacunae]BAV04298.1 acyltransferase family protein [Filimonas lacunae]SIT30949.1 Peptidoglycan/LPS O-acetylase OafA/YrhL, contains acyltransferase and SGNH-hydrolase domains [Filimonas lacunae]